ncbi:protein kinase domain-containing protein [Paraburkholderia solitsugae]|nr:protein kinase [Paraburkholderia solitsugae]
MLGEPFSVIRLLRLASHITTAVGHMHRHGQIHKDIKPANVLVDESYGSVRLTGFGISTRLHRSNGMGPLPHRENSAFAERACTRHTGADLCDRHEAAGEDCRRSLPDCLQRRERPIALPCRMGGNRQDHSFPSS